MCLATLSAAVLCITPTLIESAHASDHGGDDLDAPDVDDFDTTDIDLDAADIDLDTVDIDVDNSGPGNADDFDVVDDDLSSLADDNSGHGSGDDDDLDGGDIDNSGHGGSDDSDLNQSDDDHSGSSGDGGDNSDSDASNSGSGGDSDNSGSGSSNSGSGDDNSGHGSGDSGHEDSEQASSSLASEETIYSIETDADGGEHVLGEVIFVGTTHDLARALNLGFAEITAQNLSSGGTMARLSLPNGANLDQAVTLLRNAAPNAIVTPNTIYRHAQSSSAPTPRSLARPHNDVRLRGIVGVIDTGVDPALLPRSDALLSQTSFAGAHTVPHEHGAMVASIAVSHGARVHVADVFGRSTDGALVASAERIAAAIDWMVANRIAVVNISVEGPNNAILQEMVRRAAERGHIIVAAAGNGGPAARPVFPAAFDGVLGITAIDESLRPYVRANRGPYIDFAAQGVNVRVTLGDETTQVSGTSFAAPVIAAEAAAHLHTPSPTESARVVGRMRERAEDLGAPGRDQIFGWGALPN